MRARVSWKNTFFGHLACERCAAVVRDRFLLRRAQLSVSRGLKPCRSDLVSQAQETNQRSLAEDNLLLKWSARFGATSVYSFF
jgi:hypothetical protein